MILFSKQPRRYKSIYYNLIGKMTESNLFAAQNYQLLPYFHFYPKLKWSEYQAALNSLAASNWLIIDNEAQTAVLTSQGVILRQRQLELDYWPANYNYWELGDWEIQWQRLLLAVQVISNAQHQIHDYQPLTDSIAIQNHVKHWFQFSKTCELQVFGQELNAAMASLPGNQAQLLANSFSSQSFPGFSQSQLAQLVKLSEAEVQLRQVEVLSRLMKNIAQGSTDFSLLAQLLTQPSQILPISVQQTYLQVLSGTPVNLIRHSRSLKPTTIKEHILIAAILIPDFSFTLPSVREILATDQDGFFTQRLLEIQQQKGANRGK